MSPEQSKQAVRAVLGKAVELTCLISHAQSDANLIPRIRELALLTYIEAQQIKLPSAKPRHLRLVAEETKGGV